MKIHQIEVGDIIQHGEWSMNDTVKLPALYKIVGIGTGTGGMTLTLRSMGNDKDYIKIIKVMKL